MTRRPVAAAALAATLLLAVVMVPLTATFLGNPVEAYETALGEQRTVSLADGSIVYLNTQTKLRVSFSDTIRTVEVIDGEALFDVEKDTARPFRVVTSNAVAEALGTRFNVRHLSDHTVVSVVEGRVAVGKTIRAVTDLSAGADRLPGASTASAESLILSDGEGVTFAENLALPHKSKTDVTATTAWRQRQLVFEGNALSDILFEFNRYNKVRLVTSDDALAREQFSGVFDADDPESFVQFLKIAGDIHATKIGDEIQLFAN